MGNLFSPEGPVMGALSDLMTLLKLNLLTLLCCLPVVTAGAALTSLHYCVMKMREGEDGYIAWCQKYQFSGAGGYSLQSRR